MFTFRDAHESASKLRPLGVVAAVVLPASQASSVRATPRGGRRSTPCSAEMHSSLAANSVSTEQGEVRELDKTFLLPYNPPYWIYGD